MSPPQVPAVDWSKLKPSDISVMFGKPMTEAEFAEYRKARGGRPMHVLRPGQGIEPAPPPKQEPPQPAPKS
jgi:hypothetical protein